MMFPIIRVRDKQGDYIHIVGTNHHDTLYIDDGGGIHYYNLQNGEGTNGDYEFEGLENEWDGRPHVEFVDIDGLLDIYKAQVNLDADREVLLREMARRFRERLDQEEKRNAAEGFVHL